MMGTVNVIGFFVSLIPLIVAVVLIMWIYRIKTNSDEQVEQNKEIISLLKEIREGKD